MTPVPTSNLRTTWPTRTTVPDLGQREVHVWLISLVSDEESVDQCRAWLNPSERVQAERFLFEKHRTRFVVARVRQRQLLGRYLDQRPQEIVFQYAGLGKPAVDGLAPGEGLCFNFSNSADAALLAVARDVELGVDLERLRLLTNLVGLTERFFTAGETQEILSQDGVAQRQSFFRCWTRKEAYLKSIGKGLSVPLNEVEVSVTADGPAHICSIAGDVAAAAKWRVQHFEPADGYYGALAHCGPHDLVNCFYWAGSEVGSADIEL